MSFRKLMSLKKWFASKREVVFTQKNNILGLVILKKFKHSVEMRSNDYI